MVLILSNGISFSKPFNFYDHILRKITGFLRIQFSKNANFLETQTIFAKMSLKKVNLKIKNFCNIK